MLMYKNKLVFKQTAKNHVNASSAIWEVTPEIVQVEANESLKTINRRHQSQIHEEWRQAKVCIHNYWSTIKIDKDSEWRYFLIFLFK